MRANTKWTIAALVALAAVTVHTLHAQAIGPVSIAHDSDAAGSIHSKTYADGQGPLTQSFGIRFLARRTAWDPIAGAPPPAASACRYSTAWIKCRFGTMFHNKRMRERFEMASQERVRQL
jgi:hypothetical protein